MLKTVDETLHANKSLMVPRQNQVLALLKAKYRLYLKIPSELNPFGTKSLRHTIPSLKIPSGTKSLGLKSLSSKSLLGTKSLRAKVPVVKFEVASLKLSKIVWMDAAFCVF